MEKLLTITDAIKYLRERTGSMSQKTFLAEVAAGRIPVKPYGARAVRYRQRDLESWLNITEIHHSDFSNAAKSGTRTSRLSLMDNGLSFAKVLAQHRAMRQPRGAPNASAK